MPSFSSRTANQTILLGEKLAARCSGGEVIAIRAPLGAGKTVLTKGIARGLGITEVVTSPTYTIVSEYSGVTRLVHVDLYRIDGEDEFEQLAVNELIDQSTVTVIEWPERAGTALPARTVTVGISILSDGRREISIPETFWDGPGKDRPL